MPVVKARGNWALITQESNQGKGKLIRIQIGKNKFVKMYESDAIKQGFIEPPKDPKKKKGGQNKIKKPDQDKSAGETENLLELDPEDLSSIDGIGPATVRKLHSNGILTFEQLANAEDLSFLSSGVIEKIEIWKGSNYG